MAEQAQEIEQFLQSLDKFHPTLPDAVAEYYLRKSGFQTSDARVTRAVSLAAQKFIADIAHEALQHSKMRVARDKRKDQRFVLTTGDLAASLQA